MSERDQWLERLLVGEADPSDPAVRALFERDPAAREEYEALHALETSLGQQGDRTRATIEESEHPRDPRSEAAVRDTLARLSAGTERPATSARRRVGGRAALLAAAALVALAWSLWLREPELEQEILLDEPGSPSVEVVSPSGEVDAYTPFRWKGSLRSGGWFQVEVHDAAAPPGSEPILRSIPLMEYEWTPPTPPRTWPREILWTVQEFDVGGHPVSKRSFTASLRS